MAAAFKGAAHQAQLRYSQYMQLLTMTFWTAWTMEATFKRRQRSMLHSRHSHRMLHSAVAGWKVAVRQHRTNENLASKWYLKKILSSWISVVCSLRGECVYSAPEPASVRQCVLYNPPWLVPAYAHTARPYREIEVCRSGISY